MSAKVYINKIEKFLLNNRVSNDEMEHILGEINNTLSKSHALMDLFLHKFLKVV